MLATIVIPSYGRELELERAISSVLACKGSEEVEIIVVDDCSPAPLSPDNLRAGDRVIRNEARRGAAVSRNNGINSATGDLIYLLDSDDYFIRRDFIGDAESLSDDALYYCAIKSGAYVSRFPQRVRREDFFEGVFKNYPYLCQTSSLVFRRTLALRFDESLPRHQDWDFVYFQALLCGHEVRLAPGLICFDRSDKGSISRARNANSLAWFQKLAREPDLSPDMIEYLRFNLLASSAATLPWLDFARGAGKYFFSRDVTATTIGKNFVKRFL